LAGRCGAGVMTRRRAAGPQGRSARVADVARGLARSWADFAGAQLEGGDARVARHAALTAVRTVPSQSETMSHPILASLSKADADREIRGSKLALESLLEGECCLFAYASGKPEVDYSSEPVSVVRQAGYAAAVSTAWGAARCVEDLFQIPRFAPWDHGRIRIGGLLLANVMG